MNANKLDGRIIEVLKFIHDIFERNGIRWVLAGSISLALHGIDVKVVDIDIITDRASTFSSCRSAQVICRFGKRRGQGKSWKNS